jgi:hypothetical protein
MGCSSRRGPSRLRTASWFFRRGQESRDRVGDGIRGSPGQVMTRTLDELQAGVW